VQSACGREEGEVKLEVFNEDEKRLQIERGYISAKNTNFVVFRYDTFICFYVSGVLQMRSHIAEVFSGRTP
jgi:hypothetical protein